ncbi:MAG TPA: nicotinate-nucleotide adenylyltransferase [Parasulfuritortus sp.]
MTSTVANPAARHASPVAGQPIGLLGGTFDPIHYGHLRLAEEMADALELATVRFLPTGTPPHRGRPAASAADRLEMVKRAIAGNGRFVLDEHEAHKTEPCYMVDTLGALRNELGDAVPIVLFLGADAFAGLPAWHDWRRLFELAHLAVARRPGDGGGDWPARLPVDLAAEFAARYAPEPGILRASAAGRVFLHGITQLDISASGIRALLAAGREPRYLMPDAVLDYIHRNRLYR